MPDTPPSPKFIPLEVADLRAKGLDPNTLAPRVSGDGRPWVDKTTGKIVFKCVRGAITNAEKERYIYLDEWEAANGKHPDHVLAKRVMIRAKKGPLVRYSKTRAKSYMAIERAKGTRRTRLDRRDSVKGRTHAPSPPRPVLDTPVTVAEEPTTEEAAATALATAAKPEHLSDFFTAMKPTDMVAVDPKQLAQMAPRDALEVLTAPERVVQALKDHRFGDAEHATALITIIRDPGALDKDRITAMNALKELVREAAAAMGMSVGEVKRALETGNWDPIAQRALADKVMAGDMEAIKMAVFSGKVSSLKVVSKTPDVAIVNINGAQVHLTSEQQARLSRLDGLLRMPGDDDIPAIIDMESVPADEQETETGEDDRESTPQPILEPEDE